MTISCTALCLTLPWKTEPVLLLRTTDALRLCQDHGYDEIASYRAIDSIRRLVRWDMVDVRRFVAQAGICPLGVASYDDRRLLELLCAKVQTRELALIRGGVARPAGMSSREAGERRVLSQIEALSRPPMSYGGRQYRLVLDVRLDKLPDRNNYEVVRYTDAIAVLHGLAQQDAAGSALPERLAEAAEMLSKDWRAPFSADGLVLLRRLSASTSPHAEDGPALTPSQLKRLTQKDWLEIELVTDDGRPCSTHYRLNLGDRVVDEGDFAADGVLGLYDIESGTYELSLGELNLAAAVAAKDDAGH